MKRVIVASIAVFAVVALMSAKSIITTSDVIEASSSYNQANFMMDDTTSKGTLYGNAAGTRFCCKSGSNSCGAADC